MPSRKFSKEMLQELACSCAGDDYEGAEVMKNEQTGSRRWSIDYFLVFKFDDKFYATSYSVGATEHQEECPFEYDDDEIECTEVEPVEVMTIEYRPVSDTTC